MQKERYKINYYNSFKVIKFHDLFHTLLKGF